MTRSVGYTRRSTRLLCLALAMGFLVASCGGDDDGTSADQDGSTGSEAVDPNGVLRVGMTLTAGGNAPRLDFRLQQSTPNNHWLRMFYAPILTYTPSTNEYTPYLAESVEPTDPRTVEVVLRDDAVFDDGRPVTSEDAKASVEAMQANLASGAAPGLNAAIQRIESVEVVDEKTYRIHLTDDGLGVIFELLSSVEGYVAPADAGAAQNEHPVGNGPFKFASYEPGQALVLERSDTFFDKDNVRLAGLEFVDLVDGTPQANAVLAGDIDMTAGAGGGLTPSNTAALEGGDGIEVVTFVDGTNVTYVDLCKAEGFPFEDQEVRQALYYGTDREAMNEALFQGQGLPASQIWPEGSPNYSEDVAEEYAYDVDKAKDLLADAGYEDGMTVDLLIADRLPEWSTAGLVLQQQWEELGVEVNIVPSSDVVADWQRPSQDPATLDVDATVVNNTRAGTQKLSRLFTPGLASVPCGFSDDQLLSDIAAVQAVPADDPAAIETWKDAAAYVADNGYIIPLAFPPSITAYNSDRVGDVTQDTIGHVAVGNRFDQLFIKAS